MPSSRSVRAKRDQEQEAEVVDLIADLTRPVVSRARYLVQHPGAKGSTYLAAYHVTRSPSLIEQLQMAIEASGGIEDGPRPAYASKPAARIDAIDALVRIDNQAAKWIRTLGEDDPGSTVECIRKLGGLLPRLGKQDYKTVTRDIRSWHASAQILTGWASPPWSPNVKCPVCEYAGGLRIRLLEQIGTCVECSATWTPETIGLLAEDIRRQNSEENEPLEAVS